MGGSRYGSYATHRTHPRGKGEWLTTHTHVREIANAQRIAVHYVSRGPLVKTGGPGNDQGRVFPQMTLTDVKGADESAMPRSISW